MSAGDLLRGLRVAGPVFRLVGRHRAATVVALLLAVGWFVVGLGGDAYSDPGGHTGAHAGADPGSPVDRAADSAGTGEHRPDFGPLLAAIGRAIVIGTAFGCVILGALGVLAFGMRSRDRDVRAFELYRDDTLRDRTESGMADRADGDRGSEPAVSRLADGRYLGQAMSRQEWS